jgi:HAD superfamily hydrolase (TIGR01459 family)
MQAPMLQPIPGLSRIAERYDVLLCDVWGVIHNGRESFPAACDALSVFQAERGPVILISNAPRPAAAVIPQLRMLGVPDAAWSGFVTSGDATRALLVQHAPGPVWRIGPERDAPLYEGLDLEFADLDGAKVICCTGPFDDTTETPEDYSERLTAAAARKLPFICANPDRVVQRGDSLIYCAGALADLYAELGGEVLMAGKPYAATYERALLEAEQIKGEPVDRARVLCVGDGIATDVLGANNQHLDCLYIAGGIHAGEGAAARELLERAGAHARWCLAGLVW